MQIINCEQRSPEWFAARAGMPTASQFSTVMAKGRGGGASKTRWTYLCKLAGEILTGEPMKSFVNADMERGREMEPVALELYAQRQPEMVSMVGFVRNAIAGASPDGLVGDTGLLEIKTQEAHLHIDTALAGRPPPQHSAQCQGQMWVTEREWCDLVIYWPKLPLLCYRIKRDEDYIKEIESAVLRFREELDDILEKMHAMFGKREENG